VDLFFEKQKFTAGRHDFLLESGRNERVVALAFCTFLLPTLRLWRIYGGGWGLFLSPVKFLLFC
jgi:hypothetical protein